MKDFDNITIFFSVFLLVICIFIKKDEYFNGNTNVIIYENGNKYKYNVQNRNDKEISAKKLHKLHKTILVLIEHLNKVDSNYYGVKRLTNRYQQGIIRELHEGSDSTSYSVNKGDKLVICLRSKKTYNFQDDNTILFVVLHELAHIMTKSIGHKEEFWNNFRYLLKHAIEIKIYQYQDFNSNPEPYCGIQITDTPYKM
jgi:hypothetical protein